MEKRKKDLLIHRIEIVVNSIVAISFFVAFIAALYIVQVNSFIGALVAIIACVVFYISTMTSLILQDYSPGGPEYTDW